MTSLTPSVDFATHFLPTIVPDPRKVAENLIAEYVEKLGIPDKNVETPKNAAMGETKRRGASYSPEGVILDDVSERPVQ